MNEYDLNTRFIDINCDMGEGIENDDAILPFISSANISCGYHAGNEQTILQTIQAAQKRNVSIGAHPSFLDKENFGRVEMHLDADEIYELVTQQLLLFNEIAQAADAEFHHVKPHGALYNLSAKDKKIATAIARAVNDFDPRLVLYGLSDSASIIEAKKLGLRTASEVFADRRYLDDGRLAPRSKPGSLIDEVSEVMKQVLQMVKYGTVQSINAKEVPLKAETICLHGDGDHAVEFAKAIHQTLKQNQIAIKAI